MRALFPRPAHLTAEHAARFQQQSVVDRYHLRLPYAPELFDALAALIQDAPRNMLDVGTGTGELARGLVPFAERVDALDISPAMIERGKTLPGGDAPTLRWLLGPAETADLAPPYALIVGGSSLHWLIWEVAFPRFATMLTPQGVLAMVDRSLERPPWQADLQPLIERYSSFRKFEDFSLVDELDKRGLFTVLGEHTTAPQVHRQPVEDYVQSWHSRAGLALNTLSAGQASAFDAAVRELVMPYADGDGRLALTATGRITWGKPLDTP